MRALIRLMILVILTTMSTMATAGIYMGTSSQVPHHYTPQPTTSTMLPPASATYVPPKGSGRVVHPPMTVTAKPPRPSMLPKQKMLPKPTITATCGKGDCTPPLPKAPVRVVHAPVHHDLRVNLYTGSLKNNVESIVRRSHWGRVIWTLPYDFKWVGNINMTGPDAMSILAQLLKPYPVQAVFYDKNHVVAIVARRPNQ